MTKDINWNTENVKIVQMLNKFGKRFFIHERFTNERKLTEDNNEAGH